ncbi:LcrR family type III secretion system chaperone [Aeromonas veronii]|uniref:LcrR family type III secretion system chaperone n=1 Tax=Aeromonas veronii TaxID=654 RepID=UPI0015CFC753|nr:LcrR family type III secretion system chaperone [Aeromonas veronii]QLH67754.1 LcrR family type III secretion system chaperone [Aeromonas veronii]
MSDDPLIPWFAEHDVSTARHSLCRTPIPLGHEFVYCGLKVAWRVEPVERRVWIVLIERVDAGGGLANPFSALYLLAKAALAVLGPGYCLYGNVNVLAGSRMNGERLGRFYLRWTGASEPEPGWFSLDVAKVISLSAMRKRQNYGLA